MDRQHSISEKTVAFQSIAEDKILEIGKEEKGKRFHFIFVCCDTQWAKLFNILARSSVLF